MKQDTYIELQAKIEKAIKEQNHFWWGCEIGIAYGKRVDTIRTNEEERVTAKDFKPIVRVKYGSPYANQPKEGKIIKWYDQTAKEVLTKAGLKY